MEQTRIVAAEYREATGQALPVTAELARFDAIEKLKLLKTPKEYPFDAVDEATESHRYLIKGRVIFKGGKARQKLGQVSLDVDWDSLLMVIYDADYQLKQLTPELGHASRLFYIILISTEQHRYNPPS